MTVDKSTFCEVTKTKTRQFRKANIHQSIEEAVKGNNNICNVTRGYKNQVKPTPGLKLKKYYEAPAITNENYFSSIPFVLIIHVMSYLSLKDARSLMFVGKIFARAFQEDL